MWSLQDVCGGNSHWYTQKYSGGHINLPVHMEGILDQAVMGGSVQSAILRTGSDPYMSHLASQLGYSAGKFQALQLIVLATFGVVD